MFRFLILSSAICILLIFGYLTMEKASQTKIKEAVNDIKTTASDEIKKNIEDNPEIGETFEKSKDIANSVFEATVKPAYDDITENLNVETEAVKDPVLHTKDVNTDKWAVLSDTQEVLSNVGEMLK